MSDDDDNYLWDGSGTPDPEVQKLEKLLAPLSYERPAPDAPMLQRSNGPRWFASLAVAATVAVAAWSTFRKAQPDPSYVVTRQAGAPSVAGDRIDRDGRLAVGQWLETDHASRASVAVGTIGHVEVDPDSRLRLVESGAHQQRMELARGAIAANVIAPPRLFVVDTPSAQAIDLGCAYRLSVDEKGGTHLSVTSGWVALDNQRRAGREGRESVIPAGASCDTLPGAGPGTPYFDDAPASFRDALARYDRKPGPDALAVVLAAARPRDSLTLWHLLSRTDEKSRVLDRLSQLGAAPRDIGRDAIVKPDPEALTRYREQLQATW